MNNIITKTCGKCKTEKTIDKFSCTKRNEDSSCKSYNSWCNKCRTQQNRERLGLKQRIVPKVFEDAKECCGCGFIRRFVHYSPSKRGRLGLSAYCKKCSHKPTKEVAREYTRQYRERYKARWRAKHRLNMLKRISNIKAQSDGTVTDDFLNFVYSQEICCWCNKYIEESKRTLEHIIQLTLGGLHSIKNITMCCNSCNSKKLNRKSLTPLVKSLEERYLKYKDELS